MDTFKTFVGEWYQVLMLVMLLTLCITIIVSHFVIIGTLDSIYHRLRDMASTIDTIQSYTQNGYVHCVETKRTVNEIRELTEQIDKRLKKKQKKGETPDA